MSLPRVVIFGAGGHARVVIEALQLSRAAEIAAAVDADRALHGQTILGVKIAGGDEAITGLRASGATHFVVAVGSVSRTSVRATLFALGLREKLHPLTVRHPAAICSPSATLGAGVQLLAGCVVNTQAVLGANVIVNCGAIIEHDCVIGMHSHIASRACLAGGVRIGDEVHIGAGAVVKQGIQIGSGAVVGAGAVVLRDVTPEDVVAGVPAESIKKK